MNKVISKSTVTTTIEVYVVEYNGAKYEVVDYINEKGKVIDTEVRHANKNNTVAINEVLSAALIGLIIDFE